MVAVILKRDLESCLKVLISAFVIFMAISCNNDSESSTSYPPTPMISYSVENHFPHDTTMFTEGLLVYNGQLFESSGSPSELPQCRSIVGVLDMYSGRFSKKIEIDRKRYFGEGISILNNKIYQLTYKNQIGFVYDLKTFKQLKTFTYANGEGWGLTTNGKELLMSDGTSKITYLDSSTLQVKKNLSVTENGVARDSLNELEFINGYIYANIWLNNCIVKIDTGTGKVVGKLDLSPLSQLAFKKYSRADVLNGIAYDVAGDRIYITGKLWPNVYEIKFEH